jgi:hypothetical protein
MNGKFSAAIVAAAICLSGAEAKAVNLLVNGDFETGILTGWTTFVTSNGTNGDGLPDVAMFDTDNDGIQSLSARFNVGQAVWEGDGSPRRGGGIFQLVNLAAGSYTLSANAAMIGHTNADGGLVELLFDGSVLASHDFGTATGGVGEYAFLVGVSSVAAGPHEVRFRITRAFESDLFEGTPYQYIDKVTLIPEPSSALPAVSIFALLASRRTRR